MFSKGGEVISDQLDHLKIHSLGERIWKMGLCSMIFFGAPRGRGGGGWLSGKISHISPFFFIAFQRQN